MHRAVHKLVLIKEYCVPALYVLLALLYFQIHSLHVGDANTHFGRAR